MTSNTQKSLPINPITGQQLGRPSQDYHYNKTMQSLEVINNQKSNLVQQNYLSINQEELQKKVNEFLNLKHAKQTSTVDEYHDQFCVCTDCTYERNLSKPSHTLFNLTMRTMYKQSFTNYFAKQDKERSASKLQEKVSNFSIAKNINLKESSLYPKDKVSFQTIYNVQMKKESNPQKTKSIKNEDTLKFEGPFQNTTMYKQKFPGISGGNPYVKPTDKAMRERFSLNAKSMNSTFYTGQFTERSLLAKSPDKIKTGLPLLYKESTSQKFYSAPKNPEKYNKTFKTITKRVESPRHDKHQFGKAYSYLESVYRNSYYGPDLLEMVKHKKRLIRQTMSKLGMN